MDSVRRLASDFKLASNSIKMSQWQPMVVPEKLLDYVIWENLEERMSITSTLVYVH